MTKLRNNKKSARLSKIVESSGDNLGFVRVGAVSTVLEVGNPHFNARETANVFGQAKSRDIKVLVFPELGLTGYTCGDLFHQKELRLGAIEGLAIVREASCGFKGIAFVGMPLAVDNKLFNCAVALSDGKILGVVPKTFLPNYKEFYEKRWFAPSTALQSTEIELLGEVVPIGVDILFQCEEIPELLVGTEICEDAWALLPPSLLASLNNATVIVNLSASNELVGKAGFRRGLVSALASAQQSAYIYASGSVHESTSDTVFGGHLLIAELGAILGENKRFERETTLITAEIDLDRIVQDRLTSPTYSDCQQLYAGIRQFRVVHFSLGKVKRLTKLDRFIDAHPFVPKDRATLSERCHEIINIQVASLAKRLSRIRKKTGKDPVTTIGVSGGLDSTLALIVAVLTYDKLGMSRQSIKGYTLPGFGTTSRTKGNAHALMESLAITAFEVDIRPACLAQLQTEKHKPFGIDVAGLTVDQFTAKLVEAQDKAVATGVELKDLHFENVQARMRTKFLMDNGFVIGTGDLSEAAKGWCTYNGDHMSMYNVNCGVPKTLVKFLVEWAANNLFEGPASAAMLDVVATEISPELLPAGSDGKIAQKTEDKVGPYELTDFYLYHMVRWGATAEKMLYLAEQAKFNQGYTRSELLKWLRDLLVRFFDNQFKRDCVPNGPKVGSISLSPRGDWRMPSDAEVELWLTFVDEAIAKLPAPPKNGAAIKDNAKGIPAMTNSKPKVFRVLGRVDYQNCFRFNGSLPVEKFVDSVIGVANRVTNEIDWDAIFDSQDWHPADHGSLIDQYPDKKPFDTTILYGIVQTIWNTHGVQNSEGAEFHPELDRAKVTFTVRKGQDKRVDSYSAFYDNGRNASSDLKAQHPFLGQSTGLADKLVALADAAGADEIELTLMGVCFDICLAFTALDGATVQYKGKSIKVRVVEDASPALGDPEPTKAAFKAAGIEIIQSADILPVAVAK